MCHSFIKMVIGLFIQLDKVAEGKKAGGPPAAPPAARLVKIPREADFLTYTCEMNNLTYYYGNYIPMFVIDLNQPSDPLSF